ncbi:MAG: hypothetical protein ACO1RX_07270 [Candidatus Sericytochromatia bacterium]
MQNTKMQTLWQLCQELKTKREDLRQKLSATQQYLDQQHAQMSSELLALRDSNHALSTDLGQLQGQLQTLHTAWSEHQGNGNGSAHAAEFTRLETEHVQLQAEYNDLSAAYSELQGQFTQLQDDYQSLQNQAISAPDSDLLENLEAGYLQVQYELDQLQANSQDRVATLSSWEQLIHGVQHEFSALKDNNHLLSDDMQALTEQTNQLIGLVETYRQIALEAAMQSGMMDSTPETEAAPAVPEEDGTEASSEESGSKADAVREAVRKKITAVLRHRFGKVPRKLNTALKNIASNKELDRLFDEALKAENQESFEALLGE